MDIVQRFFGGSISPAYDWTREIALTQTGSERHTFLFFGGYLLHRSLAVAASDQMPAVSHTIGRSARPGASMENPDKSRPPAAHIVTLIAGLASHCDIGLRPLPPPLTLVLALSGFRNAPN